MHHVTRRVDGVDVVVGCRCCCCCCAKSRILFRSCNSPNRISNFGYRVEISTAWSFVYQCTNVGCITVLHAQCINNMCLFINAAILDMPSVGVLNCHRCCRSVCHWLHQSSQRLRDNVFFPFYSVLFQWCNLRFKTKCIFTRIYRYTPSSNQRLATGESW